MEIGIYYYNYWNQGLKNNTRYFIIYILQNTNYINCLSREQSSMGPFEYIIEHLYSPKGIEPDYEWQKMLLELRIVFTACMRVGMELRQHSLGRGG